MTLGEKIRYYRELQGMSQDELAQKTGYSTRSAISRIEAGGRDLNQRKILIFAMALHVDPVVLLPDTEKSDLHDLPEYDADGNKLEWTDEEYKRADLLNEMETVDVAKYEAIKAVIDAKCDSAMLASVIEKCSDKEDEKLDKIIKLIDLMV